MITRGGALGCDLRVDNEGQLLGAEEGAETAEAETGDADMANADDDTVAATAAAAAHPADAADTTNPSAAAKTASETVEEAEAEATAQHMFACCLSEERDGQWQCNGGCGRNNGGRWFHVSCKRGGQHGVAIARRHCARIASLKPWLVVNGPSGPRSEL